MFSKFLLLPNAAAAGNPTSSLTLTRSFAKKAKACNNANKNKKKAPPKPTCAAEPLEEEAPKKCKSIHPPRKYVMAPRPLPDLMTRNIQPRCIEGKGPVDQGSWPLFVIGLAAFIGLFYWDHTVTHERLYDNYGDDDDDE